MSQFSLDIERYIKAQMDLGFQLKGIVCLQYPIYCLHTSILVNTPDPLDNLDKAIMKCILLKEKITKSEITKLLGISSILVDLRINKMEEEGLLKRGKTLSITEEGENIVLNGLGKRQHLQSYDFFIDGIDFQPLPNKFYDLKYRSSFYSEESYTFYTDHDGQTQISRPFNPSVVHEPIEKDKVIRHIFYINQDDRIGFQIPEGLEEVKSIDFTKMTFPLLVALLSKDGKSYRKLIDGFSPKGEQDFLVLFEAKVSDRLKNLEIRLETFEDKNTGDKRFLFVSNWNEIDNPRDEDRLFFVSKEDLKFALCELYKLNSIDGDDILNNETEIGITLSDKQFTLDSIHKVSLLKHLIRGRDYKFGRFFNYGIWIYLITFKTNSPFVKSLVETYEFIKEAKSRKLLSKDIFEWIQKQENWRYALVLLEEYDLLESLDIEHNMITV
jgi:hypothetical protein